MVWKKARVGGTPPSLFWGQRIQRKLEFLSKILYRQVGTLVCSTVLQDQPRARKNTPK